MSIKTISALKTVSLIKYFDPFMDWLYGIALALAIIKDILDYAGIGSLPAIGTIVTFIVSFTIGMIMFITGSAKRKRETTSLLKSRYGSLVAGTIVEMIFGINFLPIETLLVIVVFYLTLDERREADIEERKTAQAGAI